MNNFETLISGEKPVLVDFYAEWCRPCQVMAPILEEVKSQIGDKATIIKINVDENRDLTAQYGIQSIPTLFIFKQGQIVWQASGVQSRATVTAALKQFI